MFRMHSVKTHSPTFGFLLTVYLAGVIVLGGAANGGEFQNQLLQAVAPLILVFILWCEKNISFSLLQKLVAALFVLCPLLAGLQLIPLPSDFWSQLPNRDVILTGFSLLNDPIPDMPVSLAPLETASGLFHFLPPFALFILTAYVLATERPFILYLPLLIVSLGVLSALLGLAQAIGPPQSNLYFYTVTNRGSGVGLFANANHHSAFLLMCLPFLVVGTTGLIGHIKNHQHHLAVRIASTTGALMLVFGVLAAGSFFGYAMLGPVAIASTLLLGTRNSPSRSIPFSRIFSIRGVIIFFGAPVLAAIGYAFATSPILPNIGITVVNLDGTLARPQLFAGALQTLIDCFPIGAGLGAYQALYPLYEDPNFVTSTYANHVHNDYLEFTLELGLLGAIIICTALILWAVTSYRAWGKTKASGANLQRAASISIFIVIAHSFVDYPLRTAAIAGLSAVAVGILVGPRSEPRRRGRLRLGEKRLVL
ncbi:MAG: O-antigen ligase family protein [Pseudomonadota bacterium]